MVPRSGRDPILRFSCVVGTPLIAPTCLFPETPCFADIQERASGLPLQCRLDNASERVLIASCASFRRRCSRDTRYPPSARADLFGGKVELRIEITIQGALNDDGLTVHTGFHLKAHPPGLKIQVAREVDFDFV